MNPVDDPEFYCHGQQCLDNGCSPLQCADTPEQEDESDYWYE